MECDSKWDDERTIYKTYVYTVGYHNVQYSDACYRPYGNDAQRQRQFADARYTLTSHPETSLQNYQIGNETVFSSG